MEKRYQFLFMKVQVLSIRVDSDVSVVQRTFNNKVQFSFVQEIRCVETRFELFDTRELGELFNMET